MTARDRKPGAVPGRICCDVLGRIKGTALSPKGHLILVGDGLCCTEETAVSNHMPLHRALAPHAVAMGIPRLYGRQASRAWMLSSRVRRLHDADSDRDCDIASLLVLGL